MIPLAKFILVPFQLLPIKRVFYSPSFHARDQQAQCLHFYKSLIWRFEIQNMIFHRNWGWQTKIRRITWKMPCTQHTSTRKNASFWIAVVEQNNDSTITLLLQVIFHNITLHSFKWNWSKQDTLYDYMSIKRFALWRTKNELDTDTLGMYTADESQILDRDIRAAWHAKSFSMFLSVQNLQTSQSETFYMRFVKAEKEGGQKLVTEKKLYKYVPIIGMQKSVVPLSLVWWENYFLLKLKFVVEKYELLSLMLDVGEILNDLKFDSNIGLTSCSGRYCKRCL